MKKFYKVLELSTGKILLDQVEKADSFGKRLLGLMGKKKLSKEQALFLEGVSCVHTCFMRFPISAVYLDREFKILDSQLLKPWRAGKIVKGARHVLETCPEAGSQMKIGESLVMIEN